MSNSFNASSPRAVAGMEFQEKILKELQQFPELLEVESTRVFFRKEDPEVTEYQLNVLEKHFGDITFLVDEERYWVECCLSMSSYAGLMCENKRKNFHGQNRWYCWGKLDNPAERVFIPAYVWRAYAGKCPMINRNNWLFRKVKPKLIGSNIRAAKLSNRHFVDALLFSDSKPF